MNFGEKLKKLRLAKGLGVNQLALKSGVSASQISRFETGERKDPTFETVKKLAYALGVSTAYFEDYERPLLSKSLMIAEQIDDAVTDEQVDEILNYITYLKQKPTNKNSLEK